MIQIVIVKWGTLYDHRHINGMIDAIRSNTKVPLRIVAITDEPAGLYDDIIVQSFPDLGLPFHKLTQRSCFGKLAMFSRGILEPDLPTLFFDLDTAVLGDVSKLVACMEQKPGIYLTSSQFFQFWKLRPLLRFIAPSSFYRANSSVVAFYPRDYYFIADEFRKNIARWLDRSPQNGSPPKLALGSDDKFISFVARDSLRVFPWSIAARFQDTYFGFSPWMSDAIGRLPLVKRTRKTRVALTFMGEFAKPEKIDSYENGDIIRLGALVSRWKFPELKTYWHAILNWSSSEND